MPKPVPQALDYDTLLAEECATYYADPLGFVLAMYDWGEPGSLQQYPGPDTWQAAMLADIGRQVTERAFDGLMPVLPIREAVSSGHGVGKSVVVAWLVDWIMSTRPHCKGTITANTATQLQSKTWAAIATWTQRCRTGHWFEVNSIRMTRKGHEKSWFCTPQSCREQNSEAFAGQHAADSTSFYIFDEASSIPESIYEVAEGGLTDGEPMVFLFGNPTRSQGSFHEATFGKMRHRWHPVIVDGRTARFTNKELIAQWVEDHGLDSDFVRVRVLGLPPQASDLQFIGTGLVQAAQRVPAVSLLDDPLVAGLDMARGGADDCVLAFRKGKDARNIPPVRIPGAQARDSMRVVSIISEQLHKFHEGQRIQQLFVDATGGSIGGPVADRLRQLGFKQVVDVQFGSDSPDKRYANRRAWLWAKLRDWLQAGGAIEPAPELETDLTGPGYFHDKHDRLLLESKEDMKKRGLSSPDYADALACTFDRMVAPVAAPASRPPQSARAGSAWG
jgi:hypothetical protein